MCAVVTKVILAREKVLCSVEMGKLVARVCTPNRTWADSIFDVAKTPAAKPTSTGQMSVVALAKEGLRTTIVDPSSLLSVVTRDSEIAFRLGGKVRVHWTPEDVNASSKSPVIVTLLSSCSPFISSSPLETLNKVGVTLCIIGCDIMTNDNTSLLSCCPDTASLGVREYTFDGKVMPLDERRHSIAPIPEVTL